MESAFWYNANSLGYDAPGFSLAFGADLFVTRLANPPARYSIHDAPEPQISPKFVPTIAFSGLPSAGPKFVSPKLKISSELSFFSSWTNYWPTWVPSEKQPGQIFWLIWGSGARSWQVLSRGPSGDRIARSCHHTGPDLTIRIGVKDRIAKLLLSQYVLGFWGPFKPWLYALGNQAKTATGSQNYFGDTIPSCRKDPVACGEAGAN